MRLQRLDLTRYGRFTDRVVDFGSPPAEGPDFHVIYGPNEAGKSTALSGYLDLLFGIPEQSRYAFLHPYATMEVGAVLAFGGGVHTLRRVKQRAASLRDVDGQPVAPALLAGPLAGLTRESYRMMFSLDDETLEQGGEAILDSQGDVGELLFSASSGLADLSRRLDAAAREADDLFRRRASSTRIAVLKRRLAELKTARDAIDVQASDHARLAEALARADEAYGRAARDLAVTRARADEIARLLRAVPLRAAHTRALAALAPLTGLPAAPAHWLGTMPELLSRDASLMARAAELDRRIAELGQTLGRPRPDAALDPLEERLARLVQETARFRTAAEDLPKRRRALAEADQRLRAIADLLGRPDTADPTALVLPAGLIGQLRDLIERHSGVNADLEAAERERRDAEEALARVEVDHRRLAAAESGLAPETVAALEAGLSAVRQSDIVARLALLEGEVERERRILSEAMAALAPWSGTPATLVGVPAPDRARRGEWRRALLEYEAAATGARRRARDLAAEHHLAVAALDALRTTAGLVDDAAATALRAERDAAWEIHRKALDGATAATFEAAMRAADAVADARATHADRLAELRTLAVTAATRQAALVAENDRVGEAAAAIDRLAEAVRDGFAAPLGLPGDAPLSVRLDAIDHWADLREAALVARDRVTEGEDRLAAARAEAARVRRDLAAALAAAGIAAGDLTLSALARAAENRLQAGADHARAATQAATAVRDRRADVDMRSRRVDAAAAAMRDWRAAFEGAVGATWFPERSRNIGAVRALLDELGELPAAVLARDDIAHRVAAMEEDCRGFVDDVGALHRELGEAFDPAAVLAAAERLLARHEAARLERRRERELRAERDRLVTDRDALATDMAAHAAEREARLAFFGVEGLMAVNERLQDCARRDALAAEAADLEDRITAEMQTPSLDQALAILDGLDIRAIEVEAGETAARTAQEEARARDLYGARTLAAERLQAIGGDDAVARIEAERRVVLLEIEDCAQRFLRLRTGRILADHALGAYRDRHRSAMMRRASEAFRLITRDAYSGLTTRAEKDREILIARSRDGASKLAQDLSKGTRFQLYLALRLAGYEEFAAVRPAVPFVADDIMETFDEMRSEEVFRLFGRMAGLGQVIYLTHHRHLCDMAARVVPTTHVHDLSS